MNKIKTLVLLVWTILPLVSFAQQDIKPGYIIDNNGVKTEGFIDYRNWDATPQKIAFKSTTNGDDVIVDVTNIREFGVNNEIYVKATIDIDTKSTSMTVNSKEIREGDIVRETRFIQLLIKGQDKALYYLKQKGSKYFIIRKSESEFETLYFRKYLYNKDGKVYTGKKRKYILQLRSYLDDCAAIKPMFNSLNPGRKSYLRLFKSYFKCKQQEITYEFVKESIITKKGFVGGLTRTSIVFPSSAEFPTLENIDFGTHTGATFGFMLEHVYPRNQRRLSWVQEFMITSYKAEGSINSFQSENTFSNTDITINYTHLKFNNLFRVGVGKLPVFFNLGPSIALRVSGSSTATTVGRYLSLPVNKTSEAVNDASLNVGVLLGAGFRAKGVSLEARLEKGGHPAKTFGGNLTRLYFLLGLYF